MEDIYPVTIHCDLFKLNFGKLDLVNLHVLRMIRVNYHLLDLFHLLHPTPIPQHHIKQDYSLLWICSTCGMFHLSLFLFSFVFVFVFVFVVFLHRYWSNCTSCNYSNCSRCNGYWNWFIFIIINYI